MIFRAADFRTWKTLSTERVIFVCFRVQTKKPRDIYTERKQTHNLRTAETNLTVSPRSGGHEQTTRRMQAYVTIVYLHIITR